METVTLRAEVAAKLIGKSPDELQGLLEGVDENKTSDVFADAVAGNFSSLRERIVTDKYNQGIKTKGRAIEGALKPLFDKYEITGFDTAEQGISLLAEKMEQDGSKTIDLSKLTPEQLEQHPLIAKLKGQVESLTAAKTDAEQAFQSYKLTEQTNAAHSAALSSTISVLEKNNAIVGNASLQDAAKLFIQSIPKKNLSISDKGDLVILGDDGLQRTDKFGKPESFDEYVRNNYTFGFNVADPNKGGSGAGTGSGGSGGGGSTLVITSEAQGIALIKERKASNDQKGAAEAQKAYSDFLRKK